ncbi:type III-B CRISPR-associated protein Cas10/Cmr2 [Caldivirga maquilingensis]|uniref:Uncharacterized protein n=1 Tax=Caldivirga maquilingensis (strain ATCC 700844 / DSM 13496 / JCM 10307 / IC-167) TaxID=397948 RepID=A8M9C3_CALMQ|nr:type III-B CRISPR-associated protein Cas10/Cmr2 [Caldivirga maquilingensis]ABW02342.1 hypothetical protein Cmaq_1518 [Caldivirga maquilingensis IC-167]
MSSINSFFEKKLLALMHDPPNKMWMIINGKDHEKEAGRIYNDIFKETGIREFTGGVPPYKDYNNPTTRIIKEADLLASSFDRWVFLKPSGANYVVKNIRYLNIFKPATHLKYEIKNQDINIDNYVKNINDILKKLNSNIKDNPRAVYNLLYALYESEWVKLGLPPSLADTRAPTHDVFDHDYATVMIMNWLLNGKFSGYYVVGDIPGVQQFIMASRKAGDLWASSWVISMTIWLTLWPLIWHYGPDILIRPTARLNPLYYTFLAASLDLVADGKDPEESDNLCLILRKAIEYDIKHTNLVNLVIELIKPLLKPLLQQIQQDQQEKLIRRVLSIAFIGEAFQLALPPINPEGNELKRLKKDDILSKIRDNFEKATKCLINISRDEVNKEENDYVKRILRRALDKGLIELRLPLRVAVLDVGNLYSKYRSEKGCPLSDDVLREIGMDREACLDALFFDYLMTSKDVIKAIREEEMTRIPTKGAWFDEQGNLLFTKLYDGDWTISTLSPDTPAVMRFGKRFENNRLCYDEKTTKWLNELLNINNPICTNTDNNNERRLISTFKPGEALSPVDLAKRLIYIGLSGKLELGFESTDDVAVKYLHSLLEYNNIANKVYRRGDKYCESLLRDYIMRPNPPRDMDLICKDQVCGNPEQIRRLARDCVEEFGKKEEDKGVAEEIIGKLTKDGVLQDIHNLVGNGADMAVNAVKELLNFHFMYAIIRGDGDSLGRIHRGELPNYYESLREFYEDLKEKANELVIGNKDEFLKDLENQEKLLSELEERLEEKEEKLEGKTKIRVPVTPAYKFAITRALMVTAMRVLARTMDISMPVYLGGDDLLILSPVEAALKIVEDSRKIYWAVDENTPFFHKVNKDYVIPALAAYGQSYSIRYAHLLDIFSEEYLRAGELLEEVAKEARWGGDYEKDSLVISHSRTGTEVVLPIRPENNGDNWVIDSIDRLRTLWTALLAGLVSSNTPEDLDKYSELFMRDQPDMGIIKDVLKTILKRNIKVTGEEGKQNVASKLLGEDVYDGYYHTVWYNLINSIRILRRLP